ncbi:MAG TPA: mannitol dehydrogenase family protein [Streptosporangiaceae bacterium]|nr:mannitol dehydrogenase family protein [Streptosporangiaceae bacterium]
MVGGGAPVRLVHLGLGNFFRAHQAWYTHHAGDADGWGYAAFTGRSPDLAVALTAQGCRYTLITRAAGGDSCERISSLSAAHSAADHEAWLGYLRSPELAAVTITVTEAGYFRRPGGGLDVTRPQIAADLAALRADQAGPVRTAPARLIAGLHARRLADVGPLAIVPCDNLPSNGPIIRRVLTDLAELVDDSLAAWFAGNVTVVTTMVDRITPRATAADIRAVHDLEGFADQCPVVTEPFSDWVISGEFPAGRPRWQDCGATFTDDVAPFEERKIWLLNGAHSLLAYAGSIIGHATVADAIADETAMEWITQWWDEASGHLSQPAAELASYRAALLARFGNGRMHDRLDRIAADGSQKLPVRVLPVLRAERAAGHLPLGASRVLAAWICHLRGLGAPVNDARADELLPLAHGDIRPAVLKVLGWLDAELAGDRDLAALVTEQSEQLSRLQP